LNNRGTRSSLLVSNRNAFMRVRLLLFALILLVPGARAQKVTSVLPQKFGHWVSNGPYKKLAANSEADDRKRAVLSESGFAELGTGTYSLGDKATTLVAYRFQDSSGAYEAFTYLRKPDMTAFDTSLSHTGALSKDRALLSAGNLVVELAPASDVSMGDLKDLLQQIVIVADKTPFPPIQTFLPKEGRIASSERYALGAVGFRLGAEAAERNDFAGLAEQAGFASGAEAMFARFKNGSQEAVLLLIDYPTPQLAELHVHHLQTILAANPKLTETSVERKGSLLSIVLGPSSAAYAAKLRNAVNYETQVTWNEASQTATDPPITSTLVKIITGTGVLMVMAVVFGVAFGGVRVITKRLFPGKVFDRPERMEVLQLGLSGKPIDPRDLY
jgi:hypothetical protein